MQKRASKSKTMPKTAYDAGRRPRAVRKRQTKQTDQSRRRRFDYPEPLLLPPRSQVPVDSGPVSPMTQPAPESAVEASRSQHEEMEPPKDSIAISPRTSDASKAASDGSSVYSRPSSPREDACLRQPIDSKMDADQTQDLAVSTAERDRLEARRLSDMHVFGLRSAQPASFGMETPIVTKVGEVEEQEPPKKARKKHSLSFWSSKTAEPAMQISPPLRPGERGAKRPPRKHSVNFWPSKTTELVTSAPMPDPPYEEVAESPQYKGSKHNRFRFDSLRSSLGDISASIGQVIGRKRSRDDGDGDADLGAEEEERARKVPRTAPQVPAFFAEAMEPLEIDLARIQAAVSDPVLYAPQSTQVLVSAAGPRGMFAGTKHSGLGQPQSQLPNLGRSDPLVRDLIRNIEHRRSRLFADEKPRVVHEHRWTQAEQREYGAYVIWALKPMMDLS